MHVDLTPVRAFLDEAHHDFAARFGDFVEREIAPVTDPPDDETARTRAREIARALGAGGWLRPIEAGDHRSFAIARETLSTVSPLADMTYALQALCAIPMAIAARASVRERWAPKLLSGEAVGAFAMTEPGAGSDVASIGTTARRDGDTYVIDGEKTYISNAGIADVYVVYASTDPSKKGKGLSAFVVPADTPGLAYTGAQVMSAPHPLGGLAFEGCRVPEENLLGEEGHGMRVGLGTLDRVRSTVAAAACGMATRALDEATRHALSRRQFGAPLAELPIVQQKLARMATDLTASRLLVYRAVWEKDGGKERVGIESSMAKAFATEAAQRIVDQAVQILGGRGVMADHPVDHLYRAVRALRIYEGATEIQELIIAGHLIAAARNETP